MDKYNLVHLSINYLTQFLYLINRLTSLFPTEQSAHQCVIPFHDPGYGCHSVSLWTWVLHSVTFNTQSWIMIILPGSLWQLCLSDLYVTPAPPATSSLHPPTPPPPPPPPPQPNPERLKHHEGDFKTTIIHCLVFRSGNFPSLRITRCLPCLNVQII